MESRGGAMSGCIWIRNARHRSDRRGLVTQSLQSFHLRGWREPDCVKRMDSATGIAGKRVFVVDDEPDLTELLEFRLRSAGFEVEVSNSPIEAIGRAREFQPDLLLLDVMMPDLDGFKLCRMLRADKSMRGIPVIFLTARGEAGDRIHGLELGAADYVAKPFDIKELVLRIGNVLKRWGPAPEQAEERLVLGDLVLDGERHALTVAGESVELTATEFKLLRLLMERKGRVQTRENLLVNVWNYTTETETRTIDTHIRRLREKLGKQGSLIETVRGVGYRIVD